MVGGKYKVAQYCQWDSYPEGQGTVVLEFLRSKSNRRALLGGARKTVLRTIPEAKASGENFAHWSRDTGGEILKIVADAERGIAMLDQIDFAADSVFCEWAYVVDFDKNVLEVFKGFNDKPLKPTARFGAMTFPREAPESHPTKYHPIRLLKHYRLNALPTTKAFVHRLNRLAHPEEVDE